MAGLADLPRTKIVCTIGPASRDATVIARLIEAGASVFRLNFSHGTPEEHGRSLAMIRSAAEAAGRPVAVLQDLCGPKFRVGLAPEEGIDCRDGEALVIQADPIVARPGRLSITYPGLADDVTPGDQILIDDGRIRLVVESAGGGEVACRVSVGGTILAGKGVNLPGVRVTAPSVTEKDLADLDWGLANGVDYVALSFVRSVEDVRRIQRIVHGRKSEVEVIAKIEKPEALDHIDAIIDVADGLMVARGDLGVEMPLERVPLIQKDLIERCHAAHKPVIVATQMLETMTGAPSPTRAEVSDVANAVFDGADAVMLSGETAVGRYPVNACLMMARVCRAVEAGLREADRRRWPTVQSREYPTADAVCHGAARIATDLGARLVIVITRSGTTAVLMSKQRLAQRVLAVSDHPPTLNRMGLLWGVIPMYSPTVTDPDELLHAAETFALRHRLMDPLDTAVLVGGTRLGQTGATDMLRVHHVRHGERPAGEGPHRVTTVESATGVHTLDQDLCIQCGVCVQRCPVDIYRFAEGRVAIDPEAAARCLFDHICTDCCPTQAITIHRAAEGA